MDHIHLGIQFNLIETIFTLIFQQGLNRISYLLYIFVLRTRKITWFARREYQ